MARWDNLLNLVNRPCFATYGVSVIYTPDMDKRPEFAGAPINLIGIFDSKREIVALGSHDGMDAVNLSLADMDALVPSEIRVLIDACQEMNPDFFTVRRRRMLMWEMESHTKYAALINSDQWMLANPGPAETTSPA
ncbi:MAG: hypothetical protein HQL95_00305 [Magnetococcales bacterium]|nr:hypothetical protein [Magnetococcales bacterium]